MENNLELNINDISEFLNKFELNKENVIDFVEYIHYKATLDSFAYIIESSEKSNDTGLFAVEYINISKKLEDIFNKLMGKINNLKDETSEKTSGE